MGNFNKSNTKMSFSSVSLVLQKLHQNYHSCFIKVKTERQIHSLHYLAIIFEYLADEKKNSSGGNLDRYLNLANLITFWKKVLIVELTVHAESLGRLLQLA